MLFPKPSQSKIMKSFGTRKIRNVLLGKQDSPRTRNGIISNNKTSLQIKPVKRVVLVEKNQHESVNGPIQRNENGSDSYNILI